MGAPVGEPLSKAVGAAEGAHVCSGHATFGGDEVPKPLSTSMVAIQGSQVLSMQTTVTR